MDKLERMRKHISEVQARQEKERKALLADLEKAHKKELAKLTRQHAILTRQRRKENLHALLSKCLNEYIHNYESVQRKCQKSGKMMAFPFSRTYSFKNLELPKFGLVSGDVRIEVGHSHAQVICISQKDNSYPCAIHTKHKINDSNLRAFDTIKEWYEKLS